MDKEKFIKGIKMLSLAYNKDFDEEQIEVWYSMLNEYTSEEFSKAIQDLIKTEKYMPSIAHITEAIAKQKTSNLPSAEDEWQEVINSIHRYGYYRQKEALDSLNPYTRKITEYIGFERICMASPEEQTWNKKNFIEEYNSLKDKEINNLQISSNEKLMLNE